MKIYKYILDHYLDTDKIKNVDHGKLDQLIRKLKPFMKKYFNRYLRGKGKISHPHPPHNNNKVLSTHTHLLHRYEFIIDNNLVFIYSKRKIYTKPKVNFHFSFSIIQRFSGQAEYHRLNHRRL